MFEYIFSRKKAIPEKLKLYGFKTEGRRYKYNTDILNGEFTLYVFVDKSEIPDTVLIETESGEEYILYKISDSGKFVSEIRSAIESVLYDISEKCYEKEIFKTEQALKLIEYIRENYGDELEYLWDKFPDNAVWRRKDNHKWYVVLLTVSRQKLGVKSDEIVEIIDLRSEPEALDSLIDNKFYYPGWHMNKRHWYTIVLDDSVPFDEICRRVDESYLLAK